MASFFGQRGTPTNPTPPATGLRIQTSVQGKALALGWGQGRTSGNLIWYGDFVAIPHSQSSGGGGKGAGGGGGGKGSSGNVTYTYQAACIFAICEGPVTAVLSCWNNKSQQTLGSVNLGAFLGGYDQLPWGYLTSLHPSEALAYRGIAYAAAGPMNLGDTQELPNLSYEVKFAICDGIPSAPDADPAPVVIDALTNPNYGAGFPADRLGPLTIYSAYARASGLVVSPVILEQQEAGRLVADLLEATNSEAVFSGGVLDIVPRGDESVTANGATYTAPTAPQYDLTESDFLPLDNGEPISVHLSAQQDLPNIVTVEYLDRANSYNPVTIDAKDDASIDAFGERPQSLAQRHMFALADAAELSAQLELGRRQIGTRFTFRLPPRFIRLDPMDIVTLTRAPLGLVRQWVRIVEIKEGNDRSLTMTAEIYLAGTGAAPVYGKQASDGYVPDYNVAPGGINDPIIFEPTDQLAGGLFVWAAVSGVNSALWGGADVYASYDGDTYQAIGQILGPARTGLLTAPLPSFPANPTGVTIDQTSTLAVSLAECNGALIGGSLADLLAFNTLCRVGEEFVAYRDATLTGPNAYDLAYLARGIYGTEAAIAEHPTGTRFCRLDQGVISFPYDQSRVGSTVYIKFCSFNIWGAGKEQISDVPAYSYTITGVALTSPLPTVENVRTVFEAGFQKIWWDDVEDFRTGIRYKVFRGDTYAGAQQVADQAHPPFIAFGAGTYWIVAYAQPVPDLFVNSEDPVSITIAGNMLVENLVHQSNQQADGWPGIFSNGVARSGPNIALGGAGDILAVPDFLALPDVLNYGGVAPSGTYEIGPQDYVDAGYIADLYINATWKVAGVPVGQNILTVEDFLSMPDVLGSASTQYVNATLQIATAESADAGDLYDADDLYEIEPDLYGYGYGIEWSEWTNFVPGVYRARLVKFRLVLTTIDPQTIATVIEFSYEISVPPRIDHYQDLDVPDTGITVTFIPDDASVEAPFNGGVPLGSTVTNQPLPFVNFSLVNQPGLHPVIDSLTLAAITFHFEDAVGTPTAVDNVNMQVEGY